MTRHSAALIIALVCLPQACATVHSNPVADRNVAIVIDNREMDFMRVYLVRGGTRIPIGEVHGTSRRTFHIPPSMLGADGSLELVGVQLAGRQEVVSEMVLVKAGQVVSWRLERVSSGMSISVR